MNDNLLKYLLVFITILLSFFILFINYINSKKNTKNYINKIIKSYNGILVKKDKNYKLNNNEIVYVKNIEDLIKISYELEKKISYFKNNNKYVFVIEADEDNMIYEVSYNE